ncbi:MAG: zinc ABC transporter substrate-binding protein [Bacteroidales bacterium]|nr:zinc ABC transporter substrate-binding protein [Bacteroidales bacterium]
MNRILNIIFSVILVSLIGSCKSPKESKEKEVISVSILPQKYFVEKIAGDAFTINVLIPPGASPASYEPSPRQIEDISKSKLYLKIGHIGFERGWINKLEDNFKQVNFADLSEGLTLIEATTDVHEDHEHYEVDPHIWMSPYNVKIIAQNIFQTLAATYPGKEKEFYNNLQSFNSEIDSLHQFIITGLENLTNRYFIIYHPALTYFASDYSLIQVPMELEGKEPGMKYMKQMVELAKDKNIKAILIQREFNMDEAMSLKREIEGEIIIIDPLDYQWDKQLRYITNQLLKVLSE